MLMVPVVYPGSSVRPLTGGTSLVSAGAAPLTPAPLIDSFDAPEGLYVCTSRFTSPPQPMIHLNPLPTTQAQLLAVYPTPRISTVSLRYPTSSRNARAAEKAKLAAQQQAMTSSVIPDTSSSSNDVMSPGAAAMRTAVSADFAAQNTRMLESPLASQGIDAPANSLTGGLAAGVTGTAAGIAGIGGPGMGFSGLGDSMGKLSSKPSRPKNNLKNTSSNFVNRMMTHPDLTKILASRTDTDHFTFMSNARSFFWLADTNGKTKESLARITFSASPTSHDVNQFTRSHDRLDIVIGFVTGDLIWLDPMASKYSRINKGGCISSSAVTQVRWLPGSENLIMAAHADGTLIIYDRERDDSTDFVPATWDALDAKPSSGVPPPSVQPAAVTDQPDSRPQMGHRTVTGSTVTTNHTADTHTSTSTESASYRAAPKPFAPGVLSERRAVGQAKSDKDPLLVVTKPGAPPIVSGLPADSSRQYQEAAAAAAVASSTVLNGMSGKGKETPWSRLNPVSHWVCSQTRITDFAFSPDFSHLAIVAEDGILRVADINSERLLDTFESYFGGLNSVVWSPDGKFVLTGGQDDLVTVWAPREGRIVARCQGHTSFVTGLAWDPWRWSTEDRTYRFASVGEDCKLILWDFSSAALKRPKTHTPYGGGGISGISGSGSGFRRGSLGLGSTYSLGDKHGPSSARRMSMGLDRPFVSEDTVRHPALPRSEVAVLQPVMSVDVGGEIPTAVRFGPDRVTVVHKNAALETFTRPLSRTGPAEAAARTSTATTQTSTGSSVRNAMQSGWLSKGARLPSLHLGLGNTDSVPPQEIATPTAARHPSSLAT